ncbi:helix-turn-helix domain-containing protein [Streptomyces sp. R41]|uniref:Helix-turn-helix domain-containing protein n=1 Tax=Streptomyces sp. R41 TaxID=3238632 RepID=A0AB39RPI1_9ACTN
MSSWQPLPEQLPSEVRHFVEQLRQLKDRTGLSLVALGARTAYSKSSWQRYLNATQPPPRQAVVALCRVAGLVTEDTERFGVRWELAVRVWPRVPVGDGPVSGGSGSGGSGSGGSVSGGSVSGGSAVGGPALDGASAGGAVPGAYEDDPTLPWWDAPPSEASSSGASMGRLPLYAALLLLVLLLVALVGAVTLG